MKANRRILGTLALLITAVASFAVGRTTSQDGAGSPLGKEHEWLGSLAGQYTAKMHSPFGESKGTRKIESALGGLWSVRHFESTVMNQPYTGLEIVGFDPLKEKFVSIWVDSMTPLVTALEGTYDADAKTLTMRGPSRGMDGEVGEMVNTTRFHDKGMTFEMDIEGQGTITTIEYTRKK